MAVLIFLFVTSAGLYFLVKKFIGRFVKSEAKQKLYLRVLLIALMMFNALVDQYGKEISLLVPITILLISFYLYYQIIKSNPLRKNILHFLVMAIAVGLIYTGYSPTDDFALDCKTKDNIIGHFVSYKGHNIFVINSPGKENTYEFGKPKEVDVNFKSYYYWGTKDYLCEAYLKALDCRTDLKIDRNTLELSLIPNAWKPDVNTEKDFDRGHIDIGDSGDFECVKVDNNILAEYYSDLQKISDAGINNFAPRAKKYKEMKRKEENDRLEQIEKDKKI